MQQQWNNKSETQQSPLELHEFLRRFTILAEIITN